MHMCKKCIPCCCSPHIHQLTGKKPAQPGSFSPLWVQMTVPRLPWWRCSILVHSEDTHGNPPAHSPPVLQLLPRRSHTDDKVYIHSAACPLSFQPRSFPFSSSSCRSSPLPCLSLSIDQHASTLSPLLLHALSSSAAFLSLTHTLGGCSVLLNTRLPCLPALSLPWYISLFSSSLSVCLGAPLPASLLPRLTGRLTCVLVPLWRWLVPQGRRSKDGLGVCTEEEEEFFFLLFFK